MISVSFVIPLFDEAKAAVRLYNALTALARAEGYTYEIIFIDNGSVDTTFEDLNKQDYVKVIKFKKRFTQMAAMYSGLKVARYDYIVTVDNSPGYNVSDIPHLINHLREHDLDIVSGWRSYRRDHLFFRLVTALTFKVKDIFVKDHFHDTGCVLRVFRRACFKTLTVFSETNRLLPALLAMKGYKTGEVVIDFLSRHRKVKEPERLVRRFIDLVSLWFWRKFAMRPLHLLGGGGLFMLAAGFLSGLWTVYLFVRGVNMTEVLWPVFTVFLSVTGLQLFISGLVADMLSKNYYEKTNDTHYEIDRVIENL